MLCDAPARKPRTHASHTAPPLPGRDHSRSPSTRVHMCPPRAPLTVVAHVSGPDRRLTALYETMFGSTSRAHQERFNGTILEFASCRLGVRVSSRAFRTTCARPFSPPPFALTAAQPSPPAPPYVCRVQPKHPCIACRTHPARAVPVPRPEHARTHRPPCRPHVAGAHVSGSGWRLPVLYETMFGSTSTCSSREFQRYRPRV